LRYEDFQLGFVVWGSDIFNLSNGEHAYHTIEQCIKSVNADKLGARRTIYHLTKDHVLVIQPLCLGASDEELAAVGVNPTVGLRIAYRNETRFRTNAAGPKLAAALPLRVNQLPCAS